MRLQSRSPHQRHIIRGGRGLGRDGRRRGREEEVHTVLDHHKIYLLPIPDGFMHKIRPILL